jgi:hypothetical protein
MCLHHIPLIKVEKISFGGVMGLIGKNIALIHLEPLPLTLI